MRLCILCPGQGAQTPAMLDNLLAQAPVAEHLHPLLEHVQFDALSTAADPALCFQNRYAQPLLVAAGCAVWLALQEAGVHAALAAGYSVGELTAHGVAGSLNPSEAIRLAHARAQAMDQAAPQGYGMMAVKGMRLDALRALASDHDLAVAIVNDEQHAVLAGASTTLKTVCKHMESSLGAHVVHLNVSVPSHTPWLGHATESFLLDVKNARWNAFDCPVLSALDGSPVDQPDAASHALAHEISNTLQWSRTLELSAEMGADAYFEVGPGNTLVRMVRERFPHAKARSISEFQQFEGAVQWLKNL